MFTKLYSQIVTSSIWNEPDHVRLLWVTMLALADENGFVGASVGGLAHAARMTRDNCEDALNVLSSPDSDSRTKDFEGRRIGDADGGWFILNYQKFREKRDREQRREYMREYMRNRRKNEKTATSVKSVNKCKPQLTQAEAEAEAEAKKSNILPTKSRKPNPLWDALCFHFGLKTDTKNEKSRVGKIVRDMKLKGIEPDQIPEKITYYKQHMSDCFCTPEALLKHWDSLKPKKPRSLIET